MYTSRLVQTDGRAEFDVCGVRKRRDVALMVCAVLFASICIRVHDLGLGKQH